ncbi:beta-1,4-glucuronyltransferase 1 [Microplitis demolitor]|uniref:beta-1,4-glucuronyltransferase 1 n=1 Tax=Microplitis demolitor TaxID=69319 RepID=UPI0004CCB32C|nr:beta-1,4-glucuronyltransferase 1 [Microplitis demolitor]XP_053593443.1 beta-1,4-glucuronyltransferase 1 [Microplitis demolitor]XP_053593447.1 beta-1,4-glucuronyltransferase 1 [Microplitis demolitor]XP_053593448.1 beta-1,4-glucuronyltransferase 1 [Microplitis demolitor]XP_053593449.1 beta-1,4-glucuronyltransferase 1 [Microplitis demolitor]XP_053593453.1 beta-1,4-glucuronyltransferase 1 [Microplitis demolitor]
MIVRRNWALRLSVVVNICVLLYICVHFKTAAWVEDASNWDNSSGSSVQEVSNDIQANSNNNNNNQSSQTTRLSSSVEGRFSRLISKVKDKPTESIEASKAIENKEQTNHKSETAQSSSLFLSGQESSPLAQPSAAAVTSSLSLKDIIKCNDKSLEARIAQRGDYWVLYNYVPMSIYVGCWESVTYTTHADFTFLDNLEPLLRRWQAPVSIALHAPGTDFQPTLDSIRYLRNCGSPLVSQFTTFHIYFNSKHVPRSVPSSEKVLSSEPYNCSLGAPWSNQNVINNKMYKNEKKLLYPVNVGRNIARESAITHYVLASDIELYPNPGLPDNFLEMIRKNDHPALSKSNPKVFVLPIFEVDKKSQPPVNKTILIKMLKSGSAIPFHKRLCSICHNIPKGKEWQDAVETTDLTVFHVGKRTGNFAHWEPIFIGTNNEPMYEERLSWEGKSDKMPQGYALCVLNYDFLILNNAFLVHRPGIKSYKKDQRRDMLTEKTNTFIKKILLPELKVMYGSRKGCVV